MVGIPTGLFISDFWEHQLVDHGRQYLFLVFVGFIGSFGFIRLSARLMRSPRVPWWPGSVVSEGGVHLHHLVWGITMMMGAGVISFALLSSGWWYEVCAFVFGVGMGLTIDEFALWIHLDDVYWSREGRSSIDASLIAAAFMGLILVGGFSRHETPLLKVPLGGGRTFGSSGTGAFLGERRRVGRFDRWASSPCFSFGRPCDLPGLSG